MIGLTKLDWNFYIIPIAKTASKKIGALIRSMKFLSPQVALHFYKSTMRTCMEYCFHVWAAYPNGVISLVWNESQLIALPRLIFFFCRFQVCSKTMHYRLK